MLSPDQILSFFQWMTIINISILVISFVLFTAFKKTVYGYHSRLFGIDESQVAVISYQYFGIYRLLVIVFNIVPYVTLYIII